MCVYPPKHQAGVQEAGGGHHLRGDGAGAESSAGPGLGVGAHQAP